MIDETTYVEVVFTLDFIVPKDPQLVREAMQRIAREIFEMGISDMMYCMNTYDYTRQVSWEDLPGWLNEIEEWSTYRDLLEEKQEGYNE